MMTRETKIGMGVACSFLCLLGVVLAGKYTTLFGTPPSSDADAQIASIDGSESAKKDPKATDKGKKAPASPAEPPAESAAGKVIAPAPRRSANP